MPSKPQLPVIVFRFQGGSRHGQAVRSDEPAEGQNEAARFWELTWRGTVGRRFDVPVPDESVFQRYQVRGKCEISGEIHVSCEHVK